MLSEADAPLYEIKADLFKGLAHPVRIRVLEILSAAPNHTCSVADMLEDMGLEASHLSQHLAVLRRYRVVTSTRVKSTVLYSLAHPVIAALLASARTFLIDNLDDSRSRLAHASELPPVSAQSPGAPA